MSKLAAAIACALLAAAPADAQFFSAGAPVDTSTFATKSDVSSIQSAMPTPSNTVPAPEALSATAGSANTYRRGDAVLPSPWRTINASTLADGTASANWPTPFVSTSPVPVGAQVLDPSLTSTVICKFATISQTGFKVFCTKPNIAPTISLGVLTLFPPIAVSTAVGVSAREPSQ